MTNQKTTISLIKADIGGYVGHSSSHPDILEAAGKKMAEAQEKRILVDYRVMHCGDDLELLMTHHNGPDAERIHQLAWDTFMACTHIAQKMKL
ncbi:MAG: fructose 1,6-bisphosphatase, partial [Nitrospirae bacterium]|nr:fructose 1,6-bisphosphatase [Nitrospirota bacterium]